MRADLQLMNVMRKENEIKIFKNKMICFEILQAYHILSDKLKARRRRASLIFMNQQKEQNNEAGAGSSVLQNTIVEENSNPKPSSIRRKSIAIRPKRMMK